jgi:hypothetical protein
MANSCDTHNRVRIHPKNWEALLRIRQRLNLTITIPSLANDMIERGLATMAKKRTK